MAEFINFESEDDNEQYETDTDDEDDDSDEINNFINDEDIIPYQEY